MTQRREPKGASGGGRFAPDIRGKTAPVPGPAVSPVSGESSDATSPSITQVYVRWREEHPGEDVFMTEDESGTMSWYRGSDLKLHRDDGPARIYPDGTSEWWRDGALHRDTGPARIHPDGASEWWRNGERVPDPVPGEDKQ